VGAQGQGRADHAPYVGAVRRELQARDIWVAEVSVTGQGGRREARMLLHPDQDAFGERVPREASVVWDEGNGWSLAARRDSETLVTGVPWHMGLGVVPEPGDVAAWVVSLLAHPEVTPSREDQPFRNHLAHDREFEVQLARYAAGA
jgi:hypothetical protein